jgi:polyhydroxyalkanoate synthesis regulator phasin
MAKKKSASRAEAVREAAEQAFKAQIPRERISELLDELGSTAGRLRGAVDELRPASEADVKSLRAEVRALIKRVEALESEPAKPKPRRKPAATAAAKPAAPRARKPPAARPPAAES